MAEVRASRLNDFSDPVAENTPPDQETLPTAAPTPTAAPAPTRTAAPAPAPTPSAATTPTPTAAPAPSTDSSKTSGYLIRGVFTKTDTKPPSSTNGYIGTSGYTKKPSDVYKKIAPHTVRLSAERPELSEPSLSADEQEKRTEAASKILNTSAGRQRSYVLSAAKKYDLNPGNEDSSASSATAFVAKRVLISDDEDIGSQSVEMSVDEPIPPEPSAATPELKPVAKPAPSPKQSDTVSALSDTLLSTPEPTSKKPAAQIISPVPETTKISKTEPSPKTRNIPNETHTQASSIAPVAVLKKSEPKPVSTPKASAAEPVAPAIPAVKEVPSTMPEPKPKPDATPKHSITPKPVENTSALNDNDLLDLTGSTPNKVVYPVPTATDLLTGDSLPKTQKTKGSLDLLAVDIIPIDTSTDKLSTDKTNTKTKITQTVVQTKTETKSTPEKLVDLGPTPTDLLTGSSLPQTQEATKSLDLLAYDVIPIDTKKDKLSTDKTRSTVETTTTVIQTKTVKKGSADPFDPIPIALESTKSPVELFDPLLSSSGNDQQQTVSVTFQQKSSKTSSPWHKWAIPTIDTAEDSEPEPEPDPEPEHDSYTSYTRIEESSPRELDTEAKRNIVYVKSYVNTSDLPRYGTSRYDNDYDYVTSSSSSYAYSSPPSTVGMTACTYCGELVGEDSKITIDHLNISCHPECFKCGICSKPMGDFIHSMFLHRGTVHCESCYSNVI